MFLHPCIMRTVKSNATAIINLLIFSPNSGDILVFLVFNQRYCLVYTVFIEQGSCPTGKSVRYASGIRQRQ